MTIHPTRSLLLWGGLLLGAPRALTQDFDPMPAVANWDLEDPHAVAVADLDGDGLLDVVVAEFERDTVSWFPGRGGGEFAYQRILNPDAEGANAVEIVDLDGDGDLDVLSTSWFDGKVAWYENLGGGSFAPEQLVINYIGGVRSVSAGDVDGDGDLDVLYAGFNEDEVAWVENLGGGQFGAATVIYAINGAWDVRAEDLDGDGDVDVLGSSYMAGQVFWFENDGTGSLGAVRIISTQVGGARGVHAADLDGDGDLDVLSASYAGSKIAWYENLGGGLFGAQQVLSLAAVGAWDVHAGDLDGDGDLDVLSTSNDDHTVAWYENQGGGTFGQGQVIDDDATNARTVATGDLDADGDLEVLTAEWGSPLGVVGWYENLGGGSFGSSQLVNRLAAQGITNLEALDLDADGDADLLASLSGPRVVVWYENRGGGDFSLQKVLTSQPSIATDPSDMHAGDLDGDGDLDVVYVAGYSFASARVAWFENLGGGSFADSEIISSAITLPQIVRAVDLEGDGDADLVIGDEQSVQITVMESLGSGAFGPPLLLDVDLDRLADLEAGDLDGDGDLDLLTGSYVDHEVVWFENLGSGQFGPQTLLTGGLLGIRDLHMADIDGDGDLDVVSAGRHHDSPTVTYTDQVSWIENLGGGSFGPTQWLYFDAFHPTWNYKGESPTEVDVGDVDADGDLDVLCANWVGDRYVWFENLGGGVFTALQEVAETDSPYLATLADLDGDGAMDFAAATNLGVLHWYRNVTTRLDCDGDGVEDATQIAAEPWLDLDQNGILDGCESSGPHWFRSPITQRLYCSLPPATWHASDLVAAQLGGHLVTVRSAYEEAWLQSAFAGTPHWTGLNDQAVEGQFVWANGESVIFENFGPSGPGNPTPDHDYVAREGLGSGAWEVLSSVDLRAAVVESDSLDCDADLVPDDIQIQGDPSLDCDLDGILDACQIVLDPSLDCDGDGVLDVCEITLDPSLDCYANGVLDACEELPPSEDFNGDGLADACFPANYCTANSNSSGNTATLELEGTPVLADADLLVRATGCAIQEWSYFIMSQGQGFVPGFAGSAGNLCVGAPIVRFNLNLVQIRKTNLVGERAYALDFSGVPENQILLGQTWHFQLWFRDGTTSNTSDGISVLFR